MKNNCPTVTVGIAAYNEEKNIRNLLQSILAQVGKINLEAVYVLNDNSTDDTRKIVSQMSTKDKRIKLVDDDKRLGKAKRLDQLYKISGSEFTFVFDGDVLLRDRFVISKTVSYFDNEKVALVGCNKIPVKADNYIGKVINVLDDIWYESRVDVNEGINVYNLSSCAFAVRTEFAKRLLPREGLLSETEYLYVSLHKKNLRAKFAREACVLFRNPDNVHDFLLQSTRFDGSAISVKNYGDWTLSAYDVSALNKIKGIIKVFLNKPFLTLSAILFRSTVKFFPHDADPLVRKGMWQTVQSSKKAINL